jgi:opacity protein-like surface antigen
MVSDLAGNMPDRGSESFTIRFKTKNSVGPFVGLDYKFNDNLSLNLEGRFIDETAVSFSANYKF